MGFFSWKTADTKKSIWNNCTKKCKPVYLLQPNGQEPILESSYEGYGVFGSIDAYAWMAKANLPEPITVYLDDDELRGLGLKLEFGSDSFKSPYGTFVKSNEKGMLLALGLISEDDEFTEFVTWSDEIKLEYGLIVINQVPSEEREEFSFGEIKYPLKFSFRKNAVYEKLPASQNCEHQGYFG